MKYLRKFLPSWQSLLLAILAAVLLVLAFPDFDLWFLAWFALVPLMWAVEREKESVAKSFVVGWVFGTLFFFGTCWWLAYAPIHYAGFPPVLAYSLVLVACLGAGIFPAIFAAILAFLLKRFGPWAFLAAPFVWVFTEFLRYWLTGNNWNALAYSQALHSTYETSWSSLMAFVSVLFAQSGGVALVSFIGMIPTAVVMIVIAIRSWKALIVAAGIIAISFVVFFVAPLRLVAHQDSDQKPPPDIGFVVAIQPNVPMSGLDQTQLEALRGRQILAAESKIAEIRKEKQYIPNDRRVPVDSSLPILVVLPESPMNFMYNDDPEFQKFVGDFARRNNVSVLFNSAEPDPTNKKYFNSAVMVGSDGREAAQYDKIFLLPFGEAVPPPLDGILPGFVGNFSYGREYDILPIGRADEGVKAGVMICFESHFGQLSREYVRNGADVIIEMTNDGYLGPTPVLRQHLANAVFRAVETNRPVLRVTNVGITAYITEKGTVLDPAPVYQEDTRVWTVSKSDGSQTFYVRFGDWFAWLCSLVAVGLLLVGIARRAKKFQPQMNADRHG